jgi:rhodanese-related sulfurtransferase
MKEISREQLILFAPSEIVDVREKEEYNAYNVGGRNIPAHELNHFVEELRQEKQIVVICSNGMRSSIVARVLEKKLATVPIFHLTEGIV